MMPGGSVVEVRLKSKKKLLGRIGNVTDSGFEFQRAGNDSDRAEVLAFQDVKSVKFKGSGSEAFAASLVRGRKATLKEQLAAIPLGSIVEVKVRRQPKLRGRLAAFTDAAVEIQHVKGDRVLNQTVAFTDVRSVKLVDEQRSPMPLSHKIIWGVVVGLGALALLVVIGCATGGCSQ